MNIPTSDQVTLKIARESFLLRDQIRTLVAEIARLQAELDARTEAANIKMFEQKEEIERLQAAFDAERKRCRDIVSAARFGEVDQDFRAILAMIDGNFTLDTENDRLRAALADLRALRVLEQKATE